MTRLSCSDFFFFHSELRAVVFVVTVGLNSLLLPTLLKHSSLTPNRVVILNPHPLKCLRCTYMYVFSSHRNPNTLVGVDATTTFHVYEDIPSPFSFHFGMCVLFIVNDFCECAWLRDCVHSCLCTSPFFIVVFSLFFCSVS